MSFPPWPVFPGGVYLDGDDIDGQIQREGLPTTVRRGIVCPCLDSETRRPDPGDPACGGWGWRYPAALEVAALPVQWTGSSLSRKAQDAGVVEPGEYTATWPSSQMLGPGDILVHPLEEAIASDALVRGHVDPLGASMERLRFSRPTAVEDLRDAGQVYLAGVDYQLGVDGRTVEWLAGGPAAGALYTVRYRHRAELIILDQLPKARHDGPTGKALPFTVRVYRYDPIARQAGANLGEGAG